MQKAVLFKGSIRKNIQMAKADATDKEIDDALAIAQAKEFVDKKKGRLDYRVVRTFQVDKDKDLQLQGQLLKSQMSLFLMTVHQLLTLLQMRHLESL